MSSIYTLKISDNMNVLFICKVEMREAKLSLNALKYDKLSTYLQIAF